MSTLNGRQIAHYRLDELIGDGGMGSVYRAYDLKLERTVALKLMHAHFARQTEFRERLTTEARVAAQLDHASIVKIFDFGEAPEGLYIAMEYVRGGSLRAHILRMYQQERYFRFSQALQIGVQIAEALDYAHRKGVVHRDVKPGNIILKRLERAAEAGFAPFQAVLTDFGLVQVMHGQRITEMGITMGTPIYMSPEQCLGRDLDGRSDLYSLGVVLYELLTNRVPFEFSDLPAAIRTHNEGTMPEPPSALRPDVPAFLDAFILKALAKRRDDRFQTGAEMAQALRTAVDTTAGFPTQVMDARPIRDPSTAPPSGYSLRLETTGQPPQTVALTRTRYTIGRHADNDIILPITDVSRHHARLRFENNTWLVEDLAGINGTLLDGARLRPGAPVPLPIGATIEIGPYRLRLASDREPATQPEQAVPTETMAVPPGARAAGRAPLGLFVDRETIALEPGESADVRVEIFNRSPIDDRVRLRLHGLPDDWVELPPGFIPVPAGERVEAIVRLKAPRRTQRHGRQRVRLDIISQQHSNQAAGVSATVDVGTLEAFEAALEPPLVDLPGEATVTVRNIGNDLLTFGVVGNESSGVLRFQGEQGRIRLEPGHSAQVKLALDSNRSRLLNGIDPTPYSVEVRTESGAADRLTGRAQAAPIIPGWLQLVALGLVAFGCIFTLISLAWDWRGAEIVAQPTATWTPTVTVTTTPTPTPSGATPTATVVGGTADDRDGDGLPNDLEDTVTLTDPDRADTDGDGLSDGYEVQNGINPLSRDTDADGLLDNDEVFTYRTRPDRADTDGDGIRDAQEIQQGSDPTNPASPGATPTPTATGVASLTPTATSTPGPSPSPSSTVTPSSTPTTTASPTTGPSPTGTATATATPTPSSTPTGTPTLTPSVTPSATPSPSATATPSPTATGTASPTASPSPSPSPTPPLAPPVVACMAAPTLEGSLGGDGWPAAAYSFEDVTVYLGKDAGYLYVALDVADPTGDLDGWARLYFDSDNSGGLPTAVDRRFELNRDLSATVAVGDGATWPGGTDWAAENWGHLGSVTPWIIEARFDLAADLSTPGPEIGLFIEVNLVGEGIQNWPLAATDITTSTWQKIDMSTACP